MDVFSTNSLQIQNVKLFFFITCYLLLGLMTQARQELAMSSGNVKKCKLFHTFPILLFSCLFRRLILIWYLLLVYQWKATRSLLEVKLSSQLWAAGPCQRSAIQLLLCPFLVNLCNLENFKGCTSLLKGHLLIKAFISSLKTFSLREGVTFSRHCLNVTLRNLLDYIVCAWI